MRVFTVCQTIAHGSRWRFVNREAHALDLSIYIERDQDAPGHKKRRPKAPFS